MKKMDDEELQKWMEENRTIKNMDGPVSDDAKAYDFLFNVLETEPLQGLPYDFSAKVTRKMQAETKRSSELRYYITGLVIFTVGMVAIYALLSSLKSITAITPYITALLQYKWIFVLAILSFLTIQYLDVVLVKAKVFKRQN